MKAIHNIDAFMPLDFILITGNIQAALFKTELLMSILQLLSGAGDEGLTFKPKELATQNFFFRSFNPEQYSGGSKWDISASIVAMKKGYGEHEVFLPVRLSFAVSIIILYVENVLLIWVRGDTWVLLMEQDVRSAEQAN